MKLLRYIQSNIGSLIFMLFFGIIFFNADAKTWVIKGLMSTGLYNADVPDSPANGLKTIPADLAFSSLDGKLIQLSEQKGKVFFINFWAAWCPPCRAEMPSINSLYNKVKNKDKIVFIMVDADNKLVSAAKFMKKNSYQLPVFAAASAVPGEIFDGSLPTTLIIGPNGSIVFQHSGMADYDKPEMLDFLNKLAE